MTYMFMYIVYEYTKKGFLESKLFDGGDSIQFI